MKWGGGTHREAVPHGGGRVGRPARPRTQPPAARERLSATAAETTYGVHNITGQSPVMRRIFRAHRQVASSRSTVLITVRAARARTVARALPLNGDRGQPPVRVVNCGGIPDTLLEASCSARQGAFTDAVADRPGRFESADTGTLFFGRIGNMSMSCNQAPARPQEREFLPPEARKKVQVDVRIIAATNMNLKR